MTSELKRYPAPWHGKVVLACRKCQKKLKNDEALHALAKLKKTVKRHNKLHPEMELHLVSVGCMDLCPKHGVTVCAPEDDSSQLVILRSEKDLERIAEGME
ncbi:hypothetical protein [Terriglobus tenax]|uniref:hypothetical protein n=1 Tax=Terriglobus tenax TaxID=1111115 RepID=UPI0021E09878|nr:hypothetical protein [Terriglobus tenax]